MDWTTAYHLAGEICDLLGHTTAKQHEQIAMLLQKRHGQKFNARHQEWNTATTDARRLRDDSPGAGATPAVAA